MLYTLRPAGTESVYGTFTGPVHIDHLPRHLPKGGLVAVRPRPGSSWASVEAQIEQVGQRVANAPIVLWPDCAGRRQAVALASAARLVGVGTVVWRRDPAADALRRQLTALDGWPQAVACWLRRRGFTPDPEAAHLLDRLATHALHCSTIAGVAAKEGPPEWKWRRVFKAASLGSLRHWHAALRAVRIGIEIQRRPAGSSADLAFEFGFSGSNALSDRLYDVIGARIRYIHRHLGWQWMLHDALRRSGIM